MPETIVCERCADRIHRDDWPSHRCPHPKPKLPIAGWLLRLEGHRITIRTLGPGPFGAVLVFATELMSADFAREDEAGVVSWLLRELGEQADA